MASQARRRLIVALDFDRLDPAYRLARRLAGHVGMFKVGSQLFTAEGPRAVEKLSRLGAGIFLDLKFHDIPNTVAGAVLAAASLPGVELLNVHAAGGVEMMRAAAMPLRGRRKRPRLLAVTVLTSLDREAMLRVGLAGTPAARAVKLARLALEAGLDGVVASAHEVQAIRRACGKSFLIVVPGVRPAAGQNVGAGFSQPPFGARQDDQARVATPAAAIRAGADYVVVGRALTAAKDPVGAAAAIAAEMEEAATSG